MSVVTPGVEEAFTDAAEELYTAADVCTNGAAAVPSIGIAPVLKGAEELREELPVELPVEMLKE